MLSDEDNVIGQNVMPYPTAIAGQAGLSYSVEDLSDRGNDNSLVYSNSANADPRHVLTAPKGSPVTFRVAQAWGGQPHVFSIEGHRFPLDDGIASSEELSSRLLVPGLTYDADLVGGAGSGFDFEGDYLFFDNRDPFTEAGLWGILRVSGAAPMCGNGVVEGTEECDGADLNGAACSDVGCGSGTPSCTGSCTLDYSTCTSCPQCGNNVLESGEVCDGTDFGGLTCNDFGCSAGALSCSVDCQTINSSACTSCGPQCGNGILETGEECDGSDFGGQTCGDFGCTGGSLVCNGNCTIDTASCTECNCADIGESCSVDGDCCSGDCSSGKPSTRVCLQ